jgi:hypothetical protein
VTLRHGTPRTYGTTTTASFEAPLVPHAFAARTRT